MSAPGSSTNTTGALRESHPYDSANRVAPVRQRPRYRGVLPSNPRTTHSRIVTGPSLVYSWVSKE